MRITLRYPKLFRAKPTIYMPIHQLFIIKIDVNILQEGDKNVYKDVIADLEKELAELRLVQICINYPIRFNGNHWSNIKPNL